VKRCSNCLHYLTLGSVTPEKRDGALYLVNYFICFECYETSYEAYLMDNKEVESET